MSDPNLVSGLIFLIGLLGLLIRRSLFHVILSCHILSHSVFFLLLSNLLNENALGVMPDDLWIIGASLSLIVFFTVGLLFFIYCRFRVTSSDFFRALRG